MNEFLLQPLTTLSRVGDKLSEYLSKLIGGGRVIDLLLHRPVRFENIAILPNIHQIINDDLVILKGKIEGHFPPAKSRQPFKINCYNQSGYFNLVFFKIYPSQLEKLKIGNEIAVLGKFSRLSGENQIIHPQEILPILQIEKMPKVNTTYPLSSTISNKFLLYKINFALNKLTDNFEEWIDKNIVENFQFNSFYETLKKLHHPQRAEDLLPMNQSRRRLAYDELLAWQLAILIAKKQNHQQKKVPIKFASDKNFLDDFIKSLPFSLTKSQIKAFEQINEEIISHKKMLRLLQGDVGSGKTIVAICACLQTIYTLKQACVVAPTTVLAKQHFNYFQKLLENFPIKIALLTSANTKKQKEQILAKLNNQEIDILISTHAVLEPDVKFKNLGLAIIDEQHRFGVLQRLKLVEKGHDVDLLLMSATPIPRTLMLGLYGDMDISILNEKPKNRQEITTSIMSQQKSQDLHNSIKNVLHNNQKVYWICPAIEEQEDLTSEDLGLVSVEKKFSELRQIYGNDKVGLIHGKMKEKEKDQVMLEFADQNSQMQILVATTVIEVGVDVATATVIVIENSENFGLAQLHQLRGRVGRSQLKSYCVLLYGKKYGPIQKQRLAIMRQSNDGFFIAEEDLRLRGSGEIIGTKQSGFPEFRIADLNFDNDLLKIANKQALIVINNDQLLLQESNKKYRFLMKLFGYYDFLKAIRGG
ncbi:ATP-dependent DNA helicase RecG [Alphaproteobacteria bacterium]|nr:ATP-dependent DNA helicase RecG [Alphaproteobacteria bacterium]